MTTRTLLTKTFNFRHEFIILYAALAAFLLTALSPIEHCMAQSNAIGFNVGGTNDYSADRVFADVFRISRMWNKIRGSTPANLDAKGWPTEDAWLYVFAGIDNMGGTYNLKFTGQANVTGGTIQNKVYDAATNTTTADVIVGATDSYLSLNFLQTNGGVRDVKMMKPILPNSTQSYTFDKLFTNEIKTVMSKASCIRFLGMNVTNGDTLTVDWNQRVPDDYYWPSLNKNGYGWEGRGASWETMIKYCNEMNIDGWINVPVLASDDYVMQLATLWKNGLNPGLKLYIEYSNELWNTGSAFGQTFKNHNLAKAEVAAGNSSLNFDGETNDWALAWRRVAKRQVEISNIFRSVVGDAEMVTRYRPVLMWQQPNGQGTASSMLTWLDYYNQLNNHPINYYLYGGGGSAYYNPNNTDPNLSLSNIWGSETFDANRWLADQTIDAEYTSAMGLKRVAYEGGPSMDKSNNASIETVKEQAWGDAKIKTLILDHHAVWSKVGGDLLCYFIVAGDYQWGFTQNIYDLNTPKYQAIDQLNSSTRDAIAIGKAIPVNCVGGDFDLAEPGWKGKSTGNVRVSAREWVGYLLNVTTAGSYEVKMDHDFASATSFRFNVDGGSALSGVQSINGTGTSGTFTLTLSKGLHFVRINNTGTSNFEVVRFYVNSSNSLPDNLPPTTPSGLTSSNLTSSGFTLNWTASTDNVGVNGYEVFKGGVLLGTTANTNYYVAGLSPSTAYSFTVRAKDAANNYSAQSTPLNVTTSANTTTYPIITARGENQPNEGKEKAFDSDNLSKWLDFSATTWLQIQYQNPVAYNQYVIVSGNDSPGRDPKNWTIQGSNDGTNWTTVDTQTGQSWTARNQANTYVFNNTTAYSYYKLNVTANTDGGGITQLSELTYNNVQVLPVSIVSFTGKATSSGNLLSWRTASEYNNSGFEVLRSTNGTEFEKIGYKVSLALNGNSGTPLDYSFRDITSDQDVYYKLNQVDIDGKATASYTIVVKAGFATENQVYPNPVTDDLNIVLNSGKTDMATISIIDQKGKVVLAKQAKLEKGRTAFKLSTYNLTAGWYLISIKNAFGEQMLSRKIIKF